MKPTVTVLDTPVIVWRAAMDLPARREHGRAESPRRLCQRGASAESIDLAPDRLAKKGLLDKSRYLESFIANRARSGRGLLRIHEELVQHGLPRVDIEKALGACEVDQSVQLCEVWRRKFARLPQDAREKAQQGRFLAYQGCFMKLISRLSNGRSDN